MYSLYYLFLILSFSLFWNSIIFSCHFITKKIVKLNQKWKNNMNEVHLTIGIINYNHIIYNTYCIINYKIYLILNVQFFVLVRLKKFE